MVAHDSFSPPPARRSGVRCVFFRSLLLLGALLWAHVPAFAAAGPRGEPQIVSSMPEPVSIAKISDDLFAVVDYQTLLIWRPSTRAFSAPSLRKPFAFNDKIPGPLMGHWHPTGVHFYNGRLYVANYIFHDVLIFALNEDASQLTLVGVLDDPDMVSPENVAVNDHGVAVADYDASGVFFFAPDGRVRWKDVSLPLAHGVAIDDSYVYVTTLAGPQKVLRYDFDGRSVPIAANFKHLLYPTHVAASTGANGRTQITIIDANRGELVFYDEAFSKRGAIGHIGPAMFNRPYGFVKTRDGFIVADTKNHRLVTLDASGRLVAEAPFAQVDQLGKRSNWGNGYAYCSDSKVEHRVFSTQFDQYAGFDVLCTMIGGTVYSHILLPHRRTSPHAPGDRPAPGFAFTWQGMLRVDGQLYWLVGSPTSNVVMIFDSSGTYVFAAHSQATKVWSVLGAEAFLADVVRGAGVAFDRMRRLSRDCSRLWAFLNMGGATSAATLDAQLRAVVELPETRSLLERWLAGENWSDPARALIAQGPTSFDDLQVLRLLAASSAVSERLVWTACKETRSPRR